MKKKSLSWLLAIVMAFTVFGGPLFMADTSYADDEDTYTICHVTGFGTSTESWNPVNTDTESNWYVGDSDHFYLVKNLDSDAQLIKNAKWDWASTTESDKTENVLDIETDTTGAAIVTALNASKGVTLTVKVPDVNGRYSSVEVTNTNVDDPANPIPFKIVIKKGAFLTEKSPAVPAQGDKEALPAVYNEITNATLNLSLTGDEEEPTTFVYLGTKEAEASQDEIAKGAEWTDFNSDIATKDAAESIHLKYQTSNVVDVEEYELEKTGENVDDRYALAITPKQAGTERVKINIGADLSNPVATITLIVKVTPGRSGKVADYTICRSALNPLSLIDTDIDEDARTWLGIDLESFLKNPVYFREVTKINKEFMDIYANGLAGYIGINMDMNGMCYGICEEVNGKYVPVSDFDKIEWESDNLDIMTYHEVLVAMLGEKNCDKIITKIVAEVQEAAKNIDTSKFKIDLTEDLAQYGLAGSIIESIVADLFDNDPDIFDDAETFTSMLDSMVIIMGSDTGTAELTATTYVGNEKVGQASVDATITAHNGDAIENVNIENTKIESNGTVTATVRWDAVEHVVDILSDDAYTEDYSYAVFLEEAGNNNHSYKHMFKNVLGNIAKAVADTTGFDIDPTTDDNGGWVDYKVVTNNSATFKGLETDKAYNVVVLAMEGTGNQYKAIGGINFYKKGSTITGEKEFEVVTKEEKTDFAEAAVTVEPATYNGTAQTPEITVKYDGKKLIEDVDYEVVPADEEYKDAGDYEVLVQGAGAFEGSQSVTFTIDPFNFEDATLQLSQYVYQETGEMCKPDITVMDAFGNVIPEKDYLTRYENCIKEGTATAVAYANSDNCVENTSAKADYKIIKSGQKISLEDCTVELDKTEFEYGDDYNEPTVTVKNGTTALKEDKDYTVAYPKSTKNVGTYTVTVTGIGDYADTNSADYVVNPQATVVTKVTAGKKKMTVKWKKETAQVDGYIIQYSRYSNFDNAQTKKVTSATVTKKVIKNLKSKKKYYVRVKTYRYGDNDGQKYESKWSAKKSVKIK